MKHATSVVCTRCGKIQKIAVAEQIPEGWRRSHADLFCPHCSGANEDEAVGDALDEEVIYPPSDTIDDGYCEVCRGPCQGH